MTINTIIIDIETFGASEDSAILSIGAFAFDRYGLNETRKEIKRIDDAGVFFMQKLDKEDQQWQI